MQPDQAGSPDGAQNTGSPAEVSNTGSANVGQPQSGPANGGQRSNQDWITMGMGIGTERALKKLGLPVDLDEAAAQLVALRDSQAAPPEQGEAPSDIEQDPRFQTVTKKLGTFERKLREMERLNQQLAAQADEARLEKLRAAALSSGVGPGRQLDAFVALYGDRVSWGPNRELQVLGQLDDGSMVPMGQNLADFVSDALQESRFLLAPEGRSGGGSKQAPVRQSEPVTDGEANKRELLKAMGVNPGTPSRLDRLFGRSGDER